MASTKTLSPCKKFTLYSKIKNEVRAALRRENVWTHVIPSSLLKRYEQDVARKVLPVRGTHVPEVEANLCDVLALFDYLELKPLLSNSARKLRDSPIFSLPEQIFNLEKEVEMHDYPHFTKKSDYLYKLEMYDVKQARYLARQHHKIDGAFHYDVWSTFVLCLDVSLDYLKNHSVSSLAKHLRHKLNQIEYARIDPSGVYYFILHCKIRGMCNPTVYATYSLWEKAWNCCNSLEKQFMLDQWDSGNKHPKVIAMQESYLMQMTSRTNYLRHESKLLRVAYIPEKTLFNPEFVFYSVWKYGIHDRMSDVERYRSACGLRLLHEAEPTMLKSNITDPIVQGMREMLPEVKETLKEVVSETVANPQTVEDIRAMTSAAIQPVVEDLTAKVKELKDQTVDELKQTVEPVLRESMGAFSSLNGILAFLKETMNSVMKMIPLDLLSHIGIKVDMVTLLEVFKYYIIYINTDSVFIKSALFLLMLKELGIFEIMQKYGTVILTWIKSFKNVSFADEFAFEAQPTSGMDWIHTVMQMFSGSAPALTICTFIAMALTIIFKITVSPPKTPLQRKEHINIYGYILEGFKNMHFIGAGMFGFERIVKYVMLISDAITKWVSVHIFGNENDDRKNEKRVSAWYGKLQYFKTDSGRNAIRVSEKVMQLAESIQPEGLGFIHGCAQDSKYLSRESIQLVHRSQKDASDLASFCARIRAMSNFQPAMFHIQFVGKPGIGKSTLTEALINHLAAALYPSDEKITHFSYNPNLDHFDGYNQQKFMIIDDLFRFNEPKHLSLLIGLITNTPVMLPMAHLEEKGMQLQSDILISSTNTPYPEAKDVFCMDAVHRRRHILINVDIDPDVMDPSNSQFSRERYMANPIYHNKDPKTFPHLRFSLLKPVIKPCEDRVKGMTSGEDNYNYQALKYIQDLNNTHKFTENEYYQTSRILPDGITEFPCKDWSFNTLIMQIAGRYAALRKNEQKLTKVQKYSHVMDSFTEIDAIQRQMNDNSSRVELDRKCELISRAYLDSSYAYGIDDPLGQKIYLEDGFLQSIPELDALEEMNEYVNDLVNDGKFEPTMNTESEAGTSYHSIPETTDQRLAFIDTINRYLTLPGRNLIQEERAQSLIRSLNTGSIDTLSAEEARFFDIILDTVLKSEEESEDDDDYAIFQRPESVLRQRYQERRDRFLQYTATQDPAGNFVNIKNKRRFLMDIKDIYYNEHIGQRIHNAELELIVGTTNFPGLMNPIDFANMNAQRQFVANLRRSGEISILKARAIEKFLNETEEAVSMIKLPRSNVFPKQQQGSQTNIPKSWLKRMVKYNDVWKLDVTDLYFTTDNDSRITPISEHPIVNVLLAHPTFLLAMQEFAMMTRTQQDYLINYNSWIMKFIPDLFLLKWKNMVKGLFDIIKEKIQTYIYNPLKWFTDTIEKYVNIHWLKLIQHVMMFVIGIMSMRQVSKLLSGVNEPTSKVMHRVNTRSVPFRSRNLQPTASFATDVNNTDVQLAGTYMDRNIRFIKITDQEGMVFSCHAIHTEQFLIINKHIADQIDDEVRFDFAPTAKSPEEWSFMIRPEDIYVYPQSDVAIIFNRKLSMARSINKHFLTEKDYLNLDTSIEMWSLSRFEHEAALEVRKGGVSYVNLPLKNTQSGQTATLCHAIITPGTTLCGKSGSMLIVPNKASGNRNIVGIQAWRYKDHLSPQVIYQVITQEMLQEMIEHVTNKAKFPYIQQTGPLEADPTMGPKSEELLESHVEVIGSISQDKIVGCVGRTAFRKTDIAPLMERDGYESERVPAALNPADPRLLISDHPMKNSLNKCGRNKVGPFDTILLDRAAQEIAYWLKPRLDKKKFNMHLSVEETITGVRMPGSNPIDCRASPGLPYIWDKYPGKPAGKKSLIEINEDGDAIINDPKFVQNFEKFYASLQKGVIPPHTSYDFPKDELRPYYKALGNPNDKSPPKTRSVTCMSLDIILAWRRVTCDLFASMHRAARGNFPFGPGLNPEGPDWGRLFHYLNEFPCVVDFDVSNWDGHMSINLLMAVGDCLCILLDIKPHSPEAKVIYSILTEVIFAHVQFQDMVYHKLRGLVSGFPGTAETNTLAHMILLYYFYLNICQNNEYFNMMNVSTFFNYVHFIVYGDDVQMSIDSSIIEWLNGQTLAEQYELHGYPVTDAAKGKDIAPYKSIYQSQFLKSSFNPISPGRVDRKLDISVCFDMFYWVRAKDHPEQQFLSNVHDAFRVLHGHGQDEYERVRALFNGWMRELGKAPFDVLWTDFERAHINNYYA
nr:MAG: putative RNA-dependent RNA polymerase [Polycipiviridae sp.]